MANNPQDVNGLSQRLADSDYAGLASLLRDAGLSGLLEAWARLGPMEKLILFKLFDPPRAMEFYARLPFKERYYLLCGFSLASIAPVIEELPPAERRHFKQLPRECYDRMFRLLASEKVEMDINVSAN